MDNKLFLKGLGYTAAGAQQAWSYYQNYLQNGGAGTYQQFIARGPGVPQPGNSTRTADMTGIIGNAAVAASVTHTMTKRKKKQKGNMGRGGKKKMMINIMTKQIEQIGVYRWQSLSEYVGSSLCAHQFFNHAYVNAGRRYLDLPVYAMNLSALPFKGNSTGTYATYPMYRLSKLLPDAGTGPTNPNNETNYFWSKVSKKKSNSLGEDETYPDRHKWYIEKQDGTPSSDKYIHDWSDINIMFQACKKWQTRVHVQIVSFLNDVGPRRSHYMTGDETGEQIFDAAITDSEANCNIDFFWDRFLQKKIVHPLAAHMQPDINERNMAIFKNDTVVLPIATTISTAAEPLTNQYKLYYTNGNTYNTCYDLEEERTGWQMVNHNAAPTATQLTVPPGFCTSSTIEPTKTAYVHNRAADKWLLLSAEVFQRDQPFDADHYPSFDINVRSKFTYFNI